MTKVKNRKHPTRHGYMSEKIQHNYITSAIQNRILPKDSHRIAQIVSLSASNDLSVPLQFWQLYSILGQGPIVEIIENFYQRVFADENWFTSVFARVGGIGHHINTQAGMWIDVMGGGPYYHGGEYRLNFHHTHNAMQLMNNKGAKRWSKLMLDALNASTQHMTDPRVRLSINTFLTHFMSKYSEDFSFENRSYFGETNPPYKRKINFLRMTSEAIESLSESEITDALEDLGVDVSKYQGKRALVTKALMI